MKNIVVMADSTCDLSEELIKKHEILTYPLHVHLGEEEYLDGVNITPQEIYKWAEEKNKAPKTSAIAIEEAKEHLDKALKIGEQVICFCISKEMSACYEVMCMAVKDMGVEDKVQIIDSMSLSAGVGLQVLEAAEMTEQGMKIEKIVNIIKELQPKVRASFVVDTLKYLHLGGRCSGIAALAGGTLKLHPYIAVENGKMSAGKKYHGRMKKVFDSYVEDITDSLKKSKSNRVFITHSGCEEEIIQMVKDKLKSMNYFDEIHVTRAGSVISCHCGPGTLGVLYIDGE